jgi:hypothetical protein
MTYMATVTLEEKRLKALKQQLFGKSDSTPMTGKDLKEAMHPRQSSPVTTTLETVNLKSDLFKIAILSILALGIQFSLFLANRNGLIKLFN